MEKVFKIASNINQFLLLDILIFLINEMLITDLDLRIERKNNNKYFIEWKTTPEMYHRFCKEFEYHSNSF